MIKSFKKKTIIIIQILLLFFSVLLLTEKGQVFIISYLEKVVGHELSIYWWSYVLRAVGSFCLTILILSVIVVYLMPVIFKKKNEKEISSGEEGSTLVLFDRYKWPVILFFTVFSAILGGLIINDGLYMRDASEYIADARELVTGVSDPNRPGTGYSCGVALILAPFYAISGLNLLVLKIPYVLLFSGTVFVLGINAYKRFKGSHAVIILSVISINYMFLEFLNGLVSDIPFLFFSTTAIVCFYEMYSENTRKKKVIMAVVAGLCTAAACLIRFNGFVIMLTALCVDIIAWVLSRRILSKIKTYAENNIKLPVVDWKIQVVYYLIFIIVYAVVSYFFPARVRGDGSNLSGISIYSLCDNVSYYFWIFKDFFTEQIHSFIRTVVWVVISPLILYGAKRCLKDEPVTLIYCIGSVLLYILWPQTQGIRFVFPVIPFFLIFLIYGYKEIGKKWIKNIYILLAMIYLGVEIYCDIVGIAINLRNDRVSKDGMISGDEREMFDYINENISPDVTIVHGDPCLLYLMTSRGNKNENSCDGWYEDPEKLTQQLKENDYVLVGNNEDFFDFYSNSGIENEVGIEIVFKTDGMTLYRSIEKTENLR